MRTIWAVLWTLFVLAVAGVVAWLLGLNDVIRASVAAGHLLDWVMGAFCLAWLIVLLKAPWDLYFQASEVAFELQRSRERRIAVVEGREEYVHALRQRLGWLAVGAHFFSAALVAAVAYFTGGRVGYYFAAFYLVSTAFRPAVAGYVYIARKLRAIGKEARYPREDVVELRDRLQSQEYRAQALTEKLDQTREELQQEVRVRDGEDRELRHAVHAVSRELESTVSRLTDNQEVIQGIQAFVRLIAQSTHPAPGSGS